MAFAIVDPAEPITLDRILATHRVLLEHIELAEYAGHIRTRQNWIGRSDYNPLNADFGTATA